jgi:dihydroorotate dehydrogenase electron transfer subunit
LFEPIATSEPIQCEAEVLRNDAIADGIHRIGLRAPEIAAGILPGQFVMLRTTSEFDPLLGRPLALWDVIRDERSLPQGIELVYQIFGRGTSALAHRRPGERLSLWGPLGNGFTADPGGRRVIAVAGGVGQTPFLALAKWWTGQARYGPIAIPHFRALIDQFELVYGARTASLFAGLGDFDAAGVAIHLATDDGSLGFHGNATDRLGSPKSVRSRAGFRSRITWRADLAPVSVASRRSECPTARPTFDGCVSRAPYSTPRTSFGVGSLRRAYARPPRRLFRLIWSRSTAARS